DKVVNVTLADSRSEILAIFQISRRVRPAEGKGFEDIDRMLFVRDLEITGCENGKSLRVLEENTRSLLEETFQRNQEKADKQDRLQKLTDLVREAKFKTVLDVAELLAKEHNNSEILEIARKLNSSEQYNDSTQRNQNIRGDIGLARTHLLEEVEHGMHFLRRTFGNGDLGRFYPENPKTDAGRQAKAIIDGLILERSGKDAREQTAIDLLARKYENLSAYKQLTPKQVKDCFDRVFTDITKDYPLYAAKNTESGSYTVRNERRGSPLAVKGENLGPVSVADFIAGHPELAMKLETLPPEQRAKFIQGVYLIGNGGLNLAMQTVQSLDENDRVVMNILLSLLGSKYMLPSAGSLVSAEQAYGIVEQLVTNDFVDLANPYRGVKSLMHVATMLAIPEIRENLNLENGAISAKELSRLQLGMDNPAEFFIRNLRPDRQDIAKVLSEFNTGKQENLFKDKRTVADLAKVARALRGSTLPISGVVDFLPLVLPVNLTQIEAYRQLALSGIEEERLGGLTLLEYTYLISDPFMRGQLFAASKDPAQSKAAEFLQGFILEKGVVMRSTLQHFADRYEKEAQHLGLSVEKAKAISEIFKKILVISSGKKVSYQEVAQALEKEFGEKDVHKVLRMLGITPEFEYGLRFNDVEDILVTQRKAAGVEAKFEDILAAPNAEEIALFRLFQPDIVTQLLGGQSNLFTRAQAQAFVQQLAVKDSDKRLEVSLGMLDQLKDDAPLYFILRALMPTQEYIMEKAFEKEGGRQVIEGALGNDFIDGRELRWLVGPSGFLRGPDKEKNTSAQVEDAGTFYKVKIDNLSNFIFNVRGDTLSVDINLAGHYNLIKGAHEIFHTGVKNIGLNPEKIKIKNTDGTINEEATRKAQERYRGLLDLIATRFEKRPLVESDFAITELGVNEALTRLLSMGATAQIASSLIGEDRDRLLWSEAATLGGLTGHANNLLRTRQNVDSVMKEIAGLSESDEALLEKIYSDMNEEREVIRTRIINELEAQRRSPQEEASVKESRVDDIYSRAAKEDREILASGEAISTLATVPAIRTDFAQQIIQNYKGGKVLVLGPGLGFLEKQVKEQGLDDIYAVEFREDFTKRVIEKGINAVRGDANSVPFADGTFSMVILPDIIDDTHINADTVFAEAGRVLAPGGNIQIVTSNDKDRVYISKVEKEEFKSKLEAQGFVGVVVSDDIKDKGLDGREHSVFFVQAQKPTLVTPVVNQNSSDINVNGGGQGTGLGTVGTGKGLGGSSPLLPPVESSSSVLNRRSFLKLSGLVAGGLATGMIKPTDLLAAKKEELLGKISTKIPENIPAIGSKIVIPSSDINLYNIKEHNKFLYGLIKAHLEGKLEKLPPVVHIDWHADDKMRAYDKDIQDKWQEILAEKDEQRKEKLIIEFTNHFRSIEGFYYVASRIGLLTDIIWIHNEHEKKFDKPTQKKYLSGRGFFGDYSSKYAEAPGTKEVNIYEGNTRHLADLLSQFPNAQGFILNTDLDFFAFNRSDYNWPYINKQIQEGNAQAERIAANGRYIPSEQELKQSQNDLIKQLEQIRDKGISPSFVTVAESPEFTPIKMVGGIRDSLSGRLIQLYGKGSSSPVLNRRSFLQLSGLVAGGLATGMIKPTDLLAAKKNEENNSAIGSELELIKDILSEPNPKIDSSVKAFINNNPAARANILESIKTFNVKGDEGIESTFIVYRDNSGKIKTTTLYFGEKTSVSAPKEILEAAEVLVLVHSHPQRIEKSGKTTIFPYFSPSDAYISSFLHNDALAIVLWGSGRDAFATIGTTKAMNSYFTTLVGGGLSALDNFPNESDRMLVLMEGAGFKAYKALSNGSLSFADINEVYKALKRSDVTPAQSSSPVNEQAQRSVIVVNALKVLLGTLGIDAIGGGQGIGGGLGTGIAGTGKGPGGSSPIIPFKKPRLPQKDKQEEPVRGQSPALPLVPGQIPIPVVNGRVVGAFVGGLSSSAANSSIDLIVPALAIGRVNLGSIRAQVPIIDGSVTAHGPPAHNTTISLSKVGRALNTRGKLGILVIVLSSVAKLVRSTVSLFKRLAYAQSATFGNEEMRKQGQGAEGASSNIGNTAVEAVRQLGAAVNTGTSNELVRVRETAKTQDAQSANSKTANSG
ncbi:MAG: methyltransferase domain-containing protein, partial [Candidatus Omnitrophica bacterium]|nr:methyltransferase domain-containing protein [Candidatus Omnitrophota bacterium]